jgi:hypothetical protein
MDVDMLPVPHVEAMDITRVHYVREAASPRYLGAQIRALDAMEEDLRDAQCATVVVTANVLEQRHARLAGEEA